MKDFFTRGLVIGILTAIVESCYTLTAYYVFRFGALRYLDYAAIMIYGQKSGTLIQSVFAQLGYFFFSAFLGIVFVYLLHYIKRDNMYLKSWFYGVLVWFAVYSLTMLYKVPLLLKIDFETSLNNFIASSIWGLGLGFFYQLMDKKFGSLKN